MSSNAVTESLLDDEGTLDVEALREQAHRELEIARLMGPSNDIEVEWVAYLEDLVARADAWLAFVSDLRGAD